MVRSYIGHKKWNPRNLLSTNEKVLQGFSWNAFPSSKPALQSDYGLGATMSRSVMDKPFMYIFFEISIGDDSREALNIGEMRGLD